MKVYFTTASTEVRKKKEECRRIIHRLESLGHVLSLDWIRMATDESEPLKGRSANPAKIFHENLSALTKASACVFETSVVSWGVIYQITYAITKEIPTLCLFDEKSRLSEISNMLPGIKSKFLEIVRYDNQNLETKVEEFLIKIEKSNLVKFNFIASEEIKDYIQWAAKRKGVSKSKFLRDAIKSNIIDIDKEYQETIL